MLSGNPTFRKGLSTVWLRYGSREMNNSAQAIMTRYGVNITLPTDISMFYVSAIPLLRPSLWHIAINLESPSFVSGGADSALPYLVPVHKW